MSWKVKTQKETSLGLGHAVSKSYDSASKGFVALFASRSHCCFGSASWSFCIQRGGECNHVNWLFFSRALGLMFAFLCFSDCLPVCFLNSLRYMSQHSWRKTILLLLKLTFGLSGILELAGPDCLFENTLHDTFLEFVDWVSQKQSTVIEAKKKKRRSTSRRNNRAGSTGVVKAQIWHCHA